MDDRKEWIRQGDDVEGYPFIVLYMDRNVFPPNRYFATKDRATDELSRPRAVQCISERKYVKNVEVSRLLWGEIPSYGVESK